MQMKDFLIIGGDAAGLSAAVQIRRKHPGASIRVINKGRIISYGACGIPYVLSGDIASSDQLIHYTPERFQQERRVKVDILHEAVDIFPDDHHVEIKNLKTGNTSREKYGKAMIATGASPRQLPFINYTQEGIFNLQSIEDLNQILHFIDLKQPKQMAIIGAGNIGLELTEAFYNRGWEPVLFEIMPSPIPTFPLYIQKAAEKKLKEKGITCFCGLQLASVEKDQDRFVLTDSNGGTYHADMVLSIVGIQPNTGFVGDKLDMMANGAILTDRQGRTSHPDVFAAGDCAAVYHQVLDRNVYFPLGSTANKMGRVAGLNMAGKTIDFPGIVGTQMFKFFDLSLGKTGLSLEEAQNNGFKAKAFSARRPDRAGYYPGGKETNVQLVVEEESARILGACAVCRTNAVRFIDTAAVAVFNRMLVSDMAWFDTAYTPPYAPVWNALVSAAMKALHP
jgi:CoA-dependent NAD(P)H sulfur oxidoreductase